MGVGGAVSRRTLETLNDAVDLLVRGLVAAQGLEGPVRDGSCVPKDPIRAFIVSKGSFTASTMPRRAPLRHDTLGDGRRAAVGYREARLLPGAEAADQVRRVREAYSA